jgi:hypothetical protein
MPNECDMWNAGAIEPQLAHVDNDSVRRAYARADYLGGTGPHHGGKMPEDGGGRHRHPPAGNMTNRRINRYFSQQWLNSGSLSLV